MREIIPPPTYGIYEGGEFMPFVKANRQEEARKLQSLIDSDPKVKLHIEEWDKEYAFRKKLALTRKEAGVTQKEVEQLSGLDQRAVSRMESDKENSPSLKTLIKYLSALGYELDIVKVAR